MFVFEATASFFAKMFKYIEEEEKTHLGPKLCHPLLKFDKNQA